MRPKLNVPPASWVAVDTSDTEFSIELSEVYQLMSPPGGAHYNGTDRHVVKDVYAWLGTLTHLHIVMRASNTIFFECEDDALAFVLKFGGKRFKKYSNNVR